MVTDQARTERETTSEEEDGAQPLRRYRIDAEAAQVQRRALSQRLISRKCYTCQQADGDDPLETPDVPPQIERIAEHCAQTADSLLPDTPLKEAIFRVILAGENKPMTADDISHVLSEKWMSTPFPRNTSTEVVQRLLDHSEAYCIWPVPKPEE